MCQFVEGVHTTLPYALAVFLVRSMLKGEGGSGGEAGQIPPPPPSERAVGWTTGALAACWSLAQFATSMLWGRVSDAGLGRRPLLAMSAVSSGVSVLLFGCSTSLAGAALARLAGGAFNCTFVALKCVIAESSPPGSQSGPMSVLALAWGCGTIVGPALGALADPCSRGGGGGGWVSRSAALCGRAAAAGPSPSGPASAEGLFRRHPYLFPCVAAAALSAAAVANATLVMEETLPALVDERRRRGRERERQRELERLGGSSQLSSRPSFPSRVLSGALSRSRRSLRRVMTLSSPYVLLGAGALGSESGNGGGDNGDRGALELSKVGGGGGGGLGGEGERSGLLALPPQQRSSPSASPPAKRSEQPRAPPSAFAPLPAAGGDDAERGKGSSSTGGGSGVPPAAASSPPPPPSPPRPAEQPPPAAAPWHQLPQVRLTLCGYGCVAFLFNLLDELVPIFASAAERDGGLGWDPPRLAPPLAVGGLALILWSQLGYFRLQKRVGTLRAARCGLAGMAPFCLLLAAPSLLPAGLARSAALSLLLVLRSVFANNAFTSSMVLVNEAAPRESIGLVNGAGQTLASFVRALGPALGGGLWGFASTSLRPPLGQFLPFFLVSLGLMASSLVYTKVLPPPGELAAAREKEAEEERAAYQLVSSAASAAEEATGKGSGEERAFSSSSSPPPVLSGEDDDGDAAADGTVKVVVVAPPPSISSS